MRVLFTTLPASGHWHPLVPFAEALRAAGHEVAFATAPDRCADIATLRFSCFHAGTDETTEEWQELRRQIAALGSGSPAWVMPNLFAGRWAAARLPALLGICDQWAPAVLVREDTDFAGCVAAERTSLPHAAVQVAAWRPWLHPLLVEPLNRLREEVGLPPDPDLAMLHRYLLIVPGPPGYQDVDNPDTPLPATARAVRHIAFDRSGEETLPAWADALQDRPVVYATMGTVFNQAPGLLEAIVEGLRDEPITLIVTTGRDRDLAAFGPQPTNVHLERYIPQSQLFPRCDLVVTHGGTGTVLTALGHGLPLVIIPFAADQPDNARRCEALGVAKVVAPEERTPVAIRAAVRAVLADRGYRRNAERLREDTARLPGPEHVVGWLEQLVAEQRPVAGAP